MILLSVLLLGDDLSGLSAVGCALSMLGSAWYGYVSLVNRQAEQAQEAQEMAKAEAEKTSSSGWPPAPAAVLAKDSKFSEAS